MKAFPLNSIDEKNFCTNQGMDLRDYFAAQALQGMTGDGVNPGAIKAIALVAYQIADAMMKAREVK